MESAPANERMDWVTYGNERERKGEKKVIPGHIIDLVSSWKMKFCGILNYINVKFCGVFDIFKPKNDCLLLASD